MQIPYLVACARKHTDKDTDKVDNNSTKKKYIYIISDIYIFVFILPSSISHQSPH